MDKWEIDVCACYDFGWYDFLVPSNYLFYKICYRSDKVKLFLVTVVRIVLLIALMLWLYSINYIAFKSNFVSKKIGMVFLATYLVLTMASLVLIVIKENVYDEQQIDVEVQKIVDDKLKKYKIEVSDDFSYQLI